MEEKQLNTQGAGVFARFAAIRANKYSDECRHLWTAKQQAQAETFKDIIGLAYSAKRTFLNYRRTMMVIKLENAIMRDRKMVRELEALCEERGYEKVRTNTGLEYCIPR